MIVILDRLYRYSTLNLFEDELMVSERKKDTQSVVGVSNILKIAINAYEGANAQMYTRNSFVCRSRVCEYARDFLHLQLHSTEIY